MGLEQRPYIGTWKINQKKVIQHTPDCIVYLNGDLSIPAVDNKGKQYRINIQKYITGVSVDAACNVGGGSATISLSLPTHANDPIGRDSNWILQPGLEVHIYMRGYFPARGLFRDASDTEVSILDDSGQMKSDTIDDVLTSSVGVTQATQVQNKKVMLDPAYTPDAFLKDAHSFSDFDSKKYGDGKDVLTKTAATAEALALLMQAMGYDQAKMYDNNAATKPSSGSKHVSHSPHHSGTAIDQNGWEATYVDENGKTQSLPMIDIFAANVVAQENGITPSGGIGWYNHKCGPHHDWRGGWYEDRNNTKPRIWLWYMPGGSGKKSKLPSLQWKYDDGSKLTGEYDIERSNGLPKNIIDAVLALRQEYEDGKFKDVPTAEQIYDARNRGDDFVEIESEFTGFATSEESNRSNFVGHGENYRTKNRYDDLLSYPYYHVFHGVVTSVDFSWSGGAQTASMSCGSMLHFWSYQNMSANAAVFGTRPSNSKNRVSLLGHNFTGMHPYEIIYNLFHHTTGAAGSVSFVLDQKTNIDAVAGENSLWSLTTKYWEERFSQRMMNLRLHGANGALLNSLQAIALAELDTQTVQDAFDSRYPSKGGMASPQRIMKSLQTLGLIAKDIPNKAAQKTATNTAQGAETEAQLDGMSFGKTGSFEKGEEVELNLFMMQAYIKDIGQIGQVNLFESSYETKMDIVNKVCEVTGFEFFQDVDGDFIFKPPMYNLDTSSSRIYRIEDIDIINFSQSHKEPEITYMVTKGSQFANLAGTGVEGEWGVQGTFIDYPLVAKFGWRSGSFETSYFNDARQCFFAAVNRMAVMNIGINSGSVTIPIRPELRPGYPVYIPSYDCFYYCNALSHQYQAGGSCQTTLQLVGKRSKFFAPGDPNKAGIEGIILGGYQLPPKPLQTIDNDGYAELSGFPNVVMSLDPTLLNPMFFVSGADFESLTQPETLEELLKLLAATTMDSHTFTLVPKSNPPVYKWTSTVKGQQGTVYLTINSAGSTSVASGGSGATPDQAINLVKSGGDLYQEGWSDANMKINETVARYTSQIGGLSNSLDRIGSDLAKTSKGKQDGTKEDQQNYTTYNALIASKGKIEKRREKLQKELREYVENTATVQKDNSQAEVFTQKAEDISYLKEILRLVRVYGKGDENRFTGDWENLNSSKNLMDLISNKKAIFSNGNVPGTYRYYSCSHPDPEEQGQEILMAAKGTNANIVSPYGQKLRLSSPVKASQFVPSVQITQPEDRKIERPEAELKENQDVYYGIPIIGVDGNIKVTPTSEIRSLEFTQSKAKIKHRRYYEWTGSVNPYTPQDFIAAIFRMLTSDAYGDEDFFEVYHKAMGENWDGTLEESGNILLEYIHDKVKAHSKYVSSHWNTGDLKNMWRVYMEENHSGGKPGRMDILHPFNGWQTTHKDEDGQPIGYANMPEWMKDRPQADDLPKIRKRRPGSFFEDTKADVPPWVNSSTRLLNHLMLHTVRDIVSGTGYYWLVDHSNYQNGGYHPPITIMKELAPKNLWVNWSQPNGVKKFFNICALAGKGDKMLLRNNLEATGGSPTWKKNAWGQIDLIGYTGFSDMDWNGSGTYDDDHMEGWNREYHKRSRGGMGTNTGLYGGTVYGVLRSDAQDYMTTNYSKNSLIGGDIFGSHHDSNGFLRVYCVQKKSNAFPITAYDYGLQSVDGSTPPSYDINDDYEAGAVGWVGFWSTKRCFNNAWKNLNGRILRDHMYYSHTRKHSFKSCLPWQGVIPPNEHGNQDRGDSNHAWGALHYGIAEGVAEMAGWAYYKSWEKAQKANKQKYSRLKGRVELIKDVFGLSKSATASRSGTFWRWKTVNQEIPVFPISDERGYTVVGHYPYGRGLDIFSNNTHDTLLQTDPFLALDRQVVEDYVRSLQGNKFSYTDSNGQTQTLGKGDASVRYTETKLQEALEQNYSPQELLDYGLATFKDGSTLQINVQNWMADKARDGTQKLTVENTAFSLADLGFLSGTQDFPADYRSSQADVHLRAYTTDFAILASEINVNAKHELLEQLLNVGAISKDTTHTMIQQIEKTGNWEDSQRALRGYSLEGPAIDGIKKDWDDLKNAVSQERLDELSGAVSKAQESFKQAKENMENTDWPDGEDWTTDVYAGSEAEARAEILKQQRLQRDEGTAGADGTMPSEFLSDEIPDGEGE